MRSLPQLTSEYQLPPYACATWKALWSGLQELDAEFEQHLRLENELYQRAPRLP
jgi:iron-sulfur cluster repair protein YtfE (RIC family)